LRQYDGDRLGLAHVIDLGGEIVPAHRHLQQELHAGHDAVAIASASATVDEMELEVADVICGRCFRRTL
jgi:hypothetical protein